MQEKCAVMRKKVLCRVENARRGQNNKMSLRLRKWLYRYEKLCTDDGQMI